MPDGPFKLGFAQSFALRPRHQPLGRDHYRWHAVWSVAQSRHRILVFLGHPNLVGAGVYDTYKYRELLSASDIPMFAVGLIVSFIAALICVRWLIRYVASNTFVPFAWYRIVFGAVVLLTGYFGWVQWVA